MSLQSMTETEAEAFCQACGMLKKPMKHGKDIVMVCKNPECHKRKDWDKLLAEMGRKAIEQPPEEEVEA